MEGLVAVDGDADVLAARAALNGYAARVPRRYSPLNCPSVMDSASVAAYWSNAKSHCESSARLLVELTRRSPLKNDPTTTSPRAAISNRNGISTPPLTIDAFHSPTSDAGAAAR